MANAGSSKLSFKCPSCQKVLSVPTSARGKVASCPCGQKIKVPAEPVDEPVLAAEIVSETSTFQ